MTENQKKWIGGNRDASRIISNKSTHSQCITNIKNSELGMFNNVRGTEYNNSGANSKSIKIMKSMSLVVDNTIHDAKTRVRGQGGTVPPKVTHKNIEVTGKYIF
jgi:hypothetical protein